MGAESIRSPNLPGLAALDNWSSRPWLVVPATIKHGVCTAAIPGGGGHTYHSGTVIDADGFRYSTYPVLLIGNPDLRKDAWNYDGCAMWVAGNRTSRIGYGCTAYHCRR